MSATRPCAGGLALPFALGAFLLRGPPGVWPRSYTGGAEFLEYEIPLGRLITRPDRSSGDRSPSASALHRRTRQRQPGRRRPRQARGPAPDHRADGAAGRGLATRPPTRSYVAGGGDGILPSLQGRRPRAAWPASGSAKMPTMSGSMPRPIRFLVGYASALALIDPAAGRKTGDIPLAGRPESFQVEPGGTRVFVNVPDARRDRGRGSRRGPADGELGRSRTRGPTSRWRSIQPADGSWSSSASPAELAVLDAREGTDDRAPADLRRRRRRLLR